MVSDPYNANFNDKLTTRPSNGAQTDLKVGLEVVSVTIGSNLDCRVSNKFSQFKTMLPFLNLRSIIPAKPKVRYFLIIINVLIAQTKHRS